MATLKQKATFKDTLENLQQGTPLTKKEILLRNGYTTSVASNPALVFDSKYFKEKLAKIDDTVIIDKWYQWATDGTDRRVAVQCGDYLLKLKDRYPASKSKVIGLFDTLDDLTPQDNESRTTE
jgi:hypothetical protein